MIFNSDLYSEMNSSFGSNDAGFVSWGVRGTGTHSYPSLAHLLIVAYFPCTWQTLSNSLLQPGISNSFNLSEEYFSIRANL